MEDTAREVREIYNTFDRLRARDRPLDETDLLNIHRWMLMVTRTLERMELLSDAESRK